MEIFLYKDSKKEFRWHGVVNGRIEVDSGEGYKRLPTLKRSLNRFIKRIQDGDFKIVEQDWNPNPATCKSAKK